LLLGVVTIRGGAILLAARGELLVVIDALEDGAVRALIVGAPERFGTLHVDELRVLCAPDTKGRRAARRAATGWRRPRPAWWSGAAAAGEFGCVSCETLEVNIRRQPTRAARAEMSDLPRPGPASLGSP